MNWKTDLRLNDLDVSTVFEITCKRCRVTRTMTQAQIVRSEPGFIRLYLDEVEASLHCSLSHCQGGIRLAMLHEDKGEGFVGGLA